MLYFFLLSLSAFALETDNYLAWDVELKDSREQINGQIQGKIEEVVDEARGWDWKCEELTMLIASKFRTTPPAKHPLEDWMKENLSEVYVYPKDHSYRDRSIYQVLFRFYLKWTPLAPNMQVNGVYFGTDKLSHFVSTGRRYYSHFMNKYGRGSSYQDAEKSAIRFGLKNEKRMLGSWSSGVFSYADMESNYQGLKFYRSLCGGSSPLLKRVDGEWEIVRKFDIGPYVNPYWDETFNPSYRLPKNWLRTAPVLKELYCGKRKSLSVVDRMAHYRSFKHSSFSIEYIRELRARGHRLAPEPQSIEELCQ
jgi:hypothetical protein